MVRPAGLEPATIRLEGGCSIQLSYGRILDLRKVVGVEGFEPPTFCSQSRRATGLRYTPKLDSLCVSSGAHDIDETKVRQRKVSIFLNFSRA
jgi:hypothetical protein